MQTLIRLIFSRAVLVTAAILAQIITLIVVIWKFSNYFVYFYGVCTFLSLLTVLWIVNGKGNHAYKLAWIIPIMAFPIFGGLFYLMFGGNKSSRRNRRKMKEIGDKMHESLVQCRDVIKGLERENRSAANQARYICKYSDCPVYMNTETEYLTPGERKYERLLEELRKAKKYIFLEYFIIKKGIMWDTILETLREKAAEGLDVRLIYDDMGCLMTLPYGYEKELQDMGIKCFVFNPFVPVLSIRLNNRDHRKIAIIDGHTAFTGGINLADEYINAYQRFGHWKDSSIVIRGEAVWNLTVMFLSMWSFLSKTDEDYSVYKPLASDIADVKAPGYVQPFADSPLDDESVGESVYLNLIGEASEYVYISTPYLILDNEMSAALCLASKRGVDVRIVTPHIADKWYVHSVSRSNYELLVESGVHIYEYTPGFIHAKTFVVDDSYAVVGTINLDYRSLFLHFECGVWMYMTKSVQEVKADYLKMLPVCQRITRDFNRDIRWHIRLGRTILKLFAPLM